MSSRPDQDERVEAAFSKILREYGLLELRLSLGDFFMPCTGTGNEKGGCQGYQRGFGMGEEKKSRTARRRNEAVSQLRKLAQWQSNDAVKLAFLGEKNLRQIKGMDLAGITELKRHGNGAIELKFIDKVRIYEMIGELLDRQDDHELNKLLDELGNAESGDEQ